MTKAANLAASANATAGNVTATNIQSNAAGTPTVFQDSAGTQVGTLCRAWVAFLGGSTPTIKSSFNVSSVTYTSTGQWAVNLTNALTDANYCVQTSNQQNSASNRSSNLGQPTSSSALNVLHFEDGSLANTASNTSMFVSVFR